MCAPPPLPLLQHRLPSLARRPSAPPLAAERLFPRARGRGVDERRRGLQATPLSARLSVPENSEVAVDMRAQLERKYGITPQSSALGPAALGARAGGGRAAPLPSAPRPFSCLPSLGGVPDKLRQAAAPREGVALRKDLC